MNTLDDSNMCTLAYFLAFVCEDFNRKLLLLLNNRNTYHNFFSTVSIMPIPLDLLGKEMGIHRQFHPPLTGYNKYRSSIHQLVDRPTGVFNRLLYRDLFVLVKAIDIDRQFHIHTYWSNNRYPSTTSRTYWSQ